MTDDYDEDRIGGDERSSTPDSDRSSLLKLFLPSLGSIRPAFTRRAQLRNDLFGGLTAAVVALPLALAFGVASGAGPMAGLYGAIATGFFAALFGGVGAQISGPTGPMTVVMAAVVASHSQNLAEAFTIVMLGGIIQMLFGVLRVGRYVEHTPYSVISGFMTGIGVIILIIQIPPFLGMPASTEGVAGTLRSLASMGPSSADTAALMVALASLSLLVFWPARLGALLPAPLGVLVLGTLAAVAFASGIPRIGEIPAGLPSMVMPSVSPDALAEVIQAAFVLALLGSIDTLLTALVADSIGRTQHDPDKELVGQGIGNLAAGLIGGLPGAGATMRTVVNLRAGGRTPISGMLHGAVLLAFALGLGPLVAKVPHAVLAAILMKVGWDIIDWGYLRRLRRAPRDKFLVMLITFLLTVFVDLITAVAVGIIIASFVTSRRLAAEQIKGLRRSADADELDHLSDAERSLLREAGGDVLVTILTGTFSYASARELSRRAGLVSGNPRVAVYDFSPAGYIDTSAALAIQEMIELSRSSGQSVLVSGLTGEAMRTLDGLGALEQVAEEERFEHRRDAIAAAVTLSRGRD